MVIIDGLGAGVEFLVFGSLTSPGRYCLDRAFVFLNKSYRFSAKIPSASSCWEVIMPCLWHQALFPWGWCVSVIPALWLLGMFEKIGEGNEKSSNIHICCYSGNSQSQEWWSWKQRGGTRQTSTKGWHHFSNR